MRWDSCSVPASPNRTAPLALKQRSRARIVLNAAAAARASKRRATVATSSAKTATAPLRTLPFVCSGASPGAAMSRGSGSAQSARVASESCTTAELPHGDELEQRVRVVRLVVPVCHGRLLGLVMATVKAATVCPHS